MEGEGSLLRHLTRVADLGVGKKDMSHASFNSIGEFTEARPLQI